MPDYGKPIENNLHWKATLDFFKNNVGGDSGVSEENPDWDESTPLPKAPVTSADHPEGPGVPLKNGFTSKERAQLRRDDRRVGRDSYPQDEDTAGAGNYPYKASVEKALLKLMKAEEKPRFRATQRQLEPFSSEEPVTYEPLPGLSGGTPGNLPRTPEEGDIGSTPTAGERAETILGRRPTDMPPEMVDAARKTSADRLAQEASPEALRERARHMRYGSRSALERGAKARAEMEADPSLYHTQTIHGKKLPNTSKAIENALLKLMKADEHLEDSQEWLRRRAEDLKDPRTIKVGFPGGPMEDTERDIPSPRGDVSQRGMDTQEWRLPSEITFGQPQPGEKPDSLGSESGKDVPVVQRGEAKLDQRAPGQENIHNNVTKSLLKLMKDENIDKDGFKDKVRYFSGYDDLERLGQEAKWGYDEAKHGTDTGEYHEEGETPGHVGSRMENVAQRAGQALGATARTLRGVQPEDYAGGPKLEPSETAKLRSGTRNMEQRAMAERHRESGKGPMEMSVEKALLKLMKGGDEQPLNAMDKGSLPKENKESQALVANGDSKRPKSEVGTNDKMFKKAEDNPHWPWQAGEGPEPQGSKRAEETKRIYQQRQINRRMAPDEHPSQSKDDAAQQRAWGDKIPMEEAILKVSSLPDDFDEEREKYEGDHNVVNYGKPLTGQEAMRRLTERDAFEGDVPHRETLPHYEHPGSGKPDWAYIKALYDAQRKAREAAVRDTDSTYEDYKHPDEGFHVNSVEKALLKLMKQGDVTPAKVGMSRQNAMRDIENAWPKAAPQAPKGVGANTNTSPLPTSAELESRRPDTDQAGQTANWSAQMFAGDLAGKFNRRFGTGQQDMVEDLKRQQEARQKFGEQYPTIARDANTPQANTPQADTTSQGFGDSGVEAQRNFQQQTGTMGNMGKPIYSSTKK